ncbi:hypothetical protein ABPG74_018226 [Tetrahymena malaccensis]
MSATPYIHTNKLTNNQQAIQLLSFQFNIFHILTILLNLVFLVISLRVSKFHYKRIKIYNLKQQQSYIARFALKLICYEESYLFRPSVAKKIIFNQQLFKRSKINKCNLTLQDFNKRKNIKKVIFNQARIQVEQQEEVVDIQQVSEQVRKQQLVCVAKKNNLITNLSIQNYIR